MQSIQNQPFTPHSIRGYGAGRSAGRAMAAEGAGGSAARRTVYVQVPRAEHARSDGQIVNLTPAVLALRIGTR